MTALEARVASLEHDLAMVATVLQNVVTSQSMFASLATAQLQAIVEQMKRLREDGDEWKDF